MPGLYDYNANADPSDPSSYAMQQLRQRIALQMLGSAQKKGYPKTFGEGLAAIGDAIGERGQMAMLERSLAAQQAGTADLQKKFPPPVTSPPPTTPPQRTSEAETTSEPVAVAARDEPPVETLAQSPAVTTALQPPPSTQGFDYRPTAQADTGTASDALPVTGISPVAAVPPRPAVDRVASLLTNGSVSLDGAGGPQVNPTQPGVSSPPINLPLSSATLGGPPEAQDNRPIQTDIQPQSVVTPGAQVAQANTGAYSGANLGPLARPAAPLPTTPDPAADPRPTPPPQPKREPESKEQIRFTQEAIRRQGLGDNPANVKYLMDQAAELEKDRAAKDVTNKLEYESALARHNAADAAWRLRQSPASRAEEMAKIEEANIVQRTGRKPEQFYPEMTKEQSAATQAVMAQNAQQLARKAIRDGVITGYGSNFRVAADKFANWALKNGMSGNLAANTEIMSAALKSGLSQAIETINGVGGRVSDQDVKIAQGIQGTDPELQMKTIKALMDRASEINNMKIDRYEGMVHNYLGAGSKYGPHPQEQTYATTPTPVTTPEKLKMFLDSQKEGADPAQAAAHRRFFDEVYGPGAAQLEISRQRRRGGR